MALSNIIKEPRREITETLIGIVLIAIPIVLSYYFSLWLEVQTMNNKGKPEVPWPAGMAIGMIGNFFLIMFIFFIHVIGEEFCDFLQKNGVNLRPRR